MEPLQRVSSEQNHALLLPFIADEVKMTLFSMHPNKAPAGLDGMSPSFFQRN